MKRRERTRKKSSAQKQIPKKSQPKKSVFADERGFFKWYSDNYLKLLIVPVLLLLFGLTVMFVNYNNTGEFINKGISFTGGVSITLQGADVNPAAITEELRGEFPGAVINYRVLGGLSGESDVVLETNIQPEDPLAEEFISSVEDTTGLPEDQISVERIGSSFGSAFFTQMAVALLIAFVFMGTVVFVYFRTFIPSAAVILAAFSNLIVTVAILDLMRMPVGTAGVAGLLMLIGYSVDTDILLTSRLLKEKEGSVNTRIFNAMKTGLTMSISTLAALTIAYFFTSSDVLREIMLVVIIGLLVDLVNTWLQNAGILKWYVQRRGAVAK